mmetsp:Transcript_37196/g.78475  ORF Transcript_37196/g.78475 Transcript_37196/m.78475 type:complete len:578 (+) Transcript_37196:236-1969(+)|eukprot:CAMPEP_0183740100 /NCGR_PEP_ID=MMETSP0737-20130205/58775_1 /TAXON_ID=385413 /ORGANISM="Thalassiosira miniscula, Strain CCMP1093" /LENGTH=577 /DNA_ID=CAMNT_0025975085 /DNA_START=185 /DNA_END=1918 /DNA_ORIENTATION=+
MGKIKTCLLVAAAAGRHQICRGRHTNGVTGFLISPSLSQQHCQFRSAPHRHRRCRNSPSFYSASKENEATIATWHDHHHPNDDGSARYSRDIPPSITNRIQDLISHPAVVWDESSTFASMHKKKLGQRHLKLFDRSDNAAFDGNHVINSTISGVEDFTHDHVFDQFAQTVCHAGVVARKEVFETWASALYIYSYFLSGEACEGRSIKRVVDVAAGHGLLAWALLILDDEHQKVQADDTSTSSSMRPLTAFCLDVQMPRSAEKIYASMIEKWPHLEERFDYVEGRLEQLVPHASCLLASVHACGILSDILITTTAEHGLPLALVPCCHSRKRKVLEVASPFARSVYEDIILNNKGGGVTDLADRLDFARMSALENAGLNVREVFLPSIFTGKNRLIMGFLPKLRVQSTFRKKDESQSKTSAMSPRKGQMPPLDNEPSIIPKRRFLKGFSVPCEDTKEKRELVSEISGRVAANIRKAVMHNRNHQKSPQMDISLWLPAEDAGLSEESLRHIVESKHNVLCSISKVGSIYVDPSGRRAQTFRIQYKNYDETTLLPFEDAKTMHKQLYDIIPIEFPGAECR